MISTSYARTLDDTTPTWVLDAMERAGLGHVVTTHRRIRATPRWHHCRQPVWTGLCDREDVTLDPTPTTIDGELFAILTGRHTFEMDMHGEIMRRWPAHITYATADQVHVYIAHSCTGPYPIVNNLWSPPSKTDSDIPPY